MLYIYATVAFTINIPPMLAYIPAPWIRHGNIWYMLHALTIVNQINDSSIVSCREHNKKGNTWEHGCSSRYCISVVCFSANVPSSCSLILENWGNNYFPSIQSWYKTDCFTLSHIVHGQFIDLRLKVSAKQEQHTIYYQKAMAFEDVLPDFFTMFSIVLQFYHICQGFYFIFCYHSKIWVKSHGFLGPFLGTGDPCGPGSLRSWVLLQPQVVSGPRAAGICHSLPVWMKTTPGSHGTNYGNYGMIKHVTIYSIIIMD